MNISKKNVCIILFLTSILCLAFVFSISACSNNSNNEEIAKNSHKPLISWTTDTTDKYRTDDSVNSIICVQGDASTNANVIMYTKSKENGKVIWTDVLDCSAYIGKDGLGQLTEENCHTPIGDFGVLTAFGIKSNPGTSLPYLDVDENLYCCSDSKAYNKMIDITKVPHECEGEHMIEYTPQYNYGFFLDYNKECKEGAGSAVFFHCSSDTPYTGACISVSEENMIKILQNITSDCRVIIDYAIDIDK